MSVSAQESQSHEEVLTEHLQKPIGSFSKRAFDIAFACSAIAASVVIFVLVAITLKILSPGPIFFLHERVGYGGKRFKCIKFRTMVTDAEARLIEHLKSNHAAQEEFVAMRKLRADPRIVPGIGHFLRKTSLDELPQFFNVLLGDMSVVGPRPVTEAEIPFYGANQNTYLKARPGITGHWQVSGRSTVSFEERVSLDCDYIHNWSFWRDLGIISRTLGAVLDPKTAC